MLDVCVVIVTKNHESFIGPCLESVLNSKCVCSFEIVVVDDISIDSTCAVLETFNDRVKLILRQKSRSFSNNNNIVLKKSHAKYFLVLNPDTVLPEKGIAELYNFMEKNTDAGACGPKLVYPDGSVQLSCRRFPTPMTVLLRRTPLRYLFPEKQRGKKHLMADWNHNEVRQVDWLLAACIMFRKEALENVGFFDERFRLYCEDIDLCYRLWEQGWSVYYNPLVVVIHNHLAESDRLLISKHSLWHFQSMFRYVMKHGASGFQRPGKCNYLGTKAQRHKVNIGP